MRGRTLLLVAAVVVVAAGVSLGTGLGTPTGFLALEQETAVSIGTEQTGEISVFSFDRVITIGNSTLIDVEIANQGSVDLSPVNFTVEIYDANNTLLYTYPSKEVDLPAGAFFSRTVRHTPHREGTYIVRARARIGNNIERTSDFLFVLEEFVPPPPPPRIITRRRIILEPSPPLPDQPDPVERRSWRVEAPQAVTVDQGGSATVPIRITSTGNVPVRNVRLNLNAEENLTLEYNPKILFSIAPETTESFVISLRASDDAHIDETTVNYRLRADQLSERGRFTVDVVPVVTLEQLQDQIENLELLIADAAAAQRAAERQGMNLTQVEAELVQARNAIAAAKAAVEQQQIAAARVQIDQGHGHVDAAFQALFQARTDRLTVRAPLIRPVYLLIAFAVIVGVLLVGAYYYVKERKTRRPKLLREMEEE